MLKHKGLIFFFAVALLCSGVSAQEQAGEIIGTVVLEDGSAIPGVSVEATGTNLVGAKKTVTDENGNFRLLALPPGEYTIVFTLEGFKTIKREKIKVELGRTIKINVIMQTGAIREEIVVTGQSPVLDVRKSATTVNITKETFTKLPKGRNFDSIVTVSAGVNNEEELDGISFDGASSSENVFYVDGVDTTGLFEGTAGQDVNFDFIEEVQVKSSGYAAEYGGSMGGVINVITRSGGNEFHGSAMLYFDGSSLGYNETPTLRINPLNDDEAEYVTYPEDSWTRWEPGIGLGGYIIKDKLWFFGSFMPKFYSRTRPANFIGHTDQNRDVTRDRTYYQASLKLTGQLANNLRLSISGTLDSWKEEGELPTQDGASPYDRDYDAQNWKYPSYTVGGSLDYTLGNNLMLNVTGGYWRTNRIQGVQPDGPRWFFLRSGIGYSNPGQAYLWNNYPYAAGYATLKDINDKMTATADLTYYMNLGGEHVWKLGFQYVRIGVDKNDAYPYTYYRFYWGDDYESPNLGTFPTTLGYVEARWPFGSVATINSNRYAFYIQDAWTIGEKLTINAGVRFEKEDIPSFSDLPEYSDPPIQFDFFDKIAPRIGFAYDVFGDSDLKFFGSFGIYYDVMKLAMAEGSYGGFKWISSYYNIVDPNYANFGHADHPVTGGFNGGAYFESLNWRIPSFDTTQPDMKPFAKYEYTLGVQKRLSEDVALSVRFMHNSIINAIEDIGIQLPEGETYFNGNPGSAWIQEKYDAAQAAGLQPNGVVATDPIRKYYSLQVNLDKKFSNNWLGGLSFTWSKLTGNFSGLASSDEHGRKDPGVERYFDAWFLTWDQNGNDTTGVLPTDRTWQFKAYGAYSFDWGLTVGFNAYAMTGTPWQTEVYLNGMQGWYPFGRGQVLGQDGTQRTPFLWQVDAYLEYNLKLSDKYTLQLNANITNLTDNEIAQRIHQLYNDARIYVDEQVIYDGFNSIQEVADKGAHLDPRYGMERNYMAALAARVGVKLLF
jgi:hypothetical protein